MATPITVYIDGIKSCLKSKYPNYKSFDDISIYLVYNNKVEYTIRFSYRKYKSKENWFYEIINSYGNSVTSFDKNYILCVTVIYFDIDDIEHEQLIYDKNDIPKNDRHHDKYLDKIINISHLIVKYIYSKINKK